MRARRHSISPVLRFILAPRAGAVPVRSHPFATRTHREHFLMNRRQVLSAAVTLLVAPAVHAADEPVHVPFSQDAYEQALASGEPLLLDFYASW